MKIEIKSCVDGSVLYFHEQYGNTMKITLELAVKAGAELNYAELNYAKLNGAKLNDAKLNGAELNHAELNGAKLNGAELNGAEYGLSIPKPLIEIAAKLHGIIKGE